MLIALGEKIQSSIPDVTIEKISDVLCRVRRIDFVTLVILVQGSLRPGNRCNYYKANY